MVVCTVLGADHHLLGPHGIDLIPRARGSVTRLLQLCGGLSRQQAVKERAVALQRDPEVFS